MRHFGAWVLRSFGGAGGLPPSGDFALSPPDLFPQALGTGAEAERAHDTVIAATP